jgi:hypothetical protein
VRAEVFQVEEVLGDRDGQESLFGSKVGAIRVARTVMGRREEGDFLAVRVVKFVSEA